MYALSPYISAFAGALILFVLLYPINKFLNKKLNRNVSAIICILLAILIILIPLFFITDALIDEVTLVTKDTEFIENAIQETSVKKYVTAALTFIKDQVKLSANALFGSAMQLVISSIILFFSLFFMLIHSDNFIQTIQSHLPFNDSNSKILMDEFVNVTKSTVIGMGLVAIIQGLLLGLGFLMFGLKGAVFWGFVGAVLSFLPALGISFIWVPVSVYKLLSGDYFVGIGLAVWCLIIIIATDYFARPYISQKIAKLHPLITLIGVFIGVPYFGVAGILVGPLLLSYLFLLIKMYGEEYLG